MPRKGYKCLTVTEKLHQDVRKRAHDTNRTIIEYVEYLLKKERAAKEGK